MEKNKTVIADLKGLIDILNDGKEGYLSASEVVNSAELKGLFITFANERVAYSEELKNHIQLHGGYSENEDGGILGVLHRTWIDIKQALSNNEDEAILNSIETAEKVALEEYDKVLEDPETHVDHINLLQKQRTGILEALKEIETYHSSLVR